MTLRVRTCRALAVAVVFCSPVVHAAGEVTVSGIVKDLAGLPQPGATVQIVEESTNKEIAVSPTDEVGRYTFASVAPGTYLISATVAGSHPTVTKTIIN